jgi:uncharacterized protein (DUF2336 family)
MQTFVSVVNEVENAVSSGDPVRRIDTLRKMTSLFVEQSPGLKELHVAVFDEVILRLSRDLEFKVRVELADKMADIKNAPRKVVRDLAHDDNIAVAQPVLERSSRLDETDLVAIAKAKGQDHLLALSRRPTLSENVTDILVDRGDEKVVRTVAGNDGARFSEQGFSQLVDKAQKDTSLQDIIKKRGSISATQMQQLVNIAREKVRETLQDEQDVPDASIDDAVNSVAQALALDESTKSLISDFKEAQALIDRKQANGGITEADIVTWIREGNIEEALVAMASLASIPVDMVARAYHAASFDPLLFIIRALRFNWATFKLLLMTKAGRMPSLEVLKNAFDAFQQLSVQTAQRIIRFTAAREKAQSEAA